MMKPYNTRLCARTAIAAILALGSTPLLAQVAEAPTTVAPAPVLVIPETPAPPPAQPTIVLPTELPDTTEPPTTVAPPERTTTTTRTERATSPAAAPDPAPRVRAAAPADPAPVALEDDGDPLASDTEVAAEPAAAIAEPAPAAATAPVDTADDTQFWVAVIAGLAAVALAIWGFVAIGRRRPADRKAAAIIERPVVTPREPVSAAPVATTPAAAVTPLASPRPAPAASLSHSGASVPLPSRIPATFAERDALIKRMIAAQPDRANPFTSPIQRRKRAKLILQSLGRDFGDAEPWIDLSQYPQNWPELARRKQAAA